MFYLVDIIDNVILAACETRNDIHVAWLKHVQKVGRYGDYKNREMDYSMLSMNDNDLLWVPNFHSYLDGDDIRYYSEKTYAYRRFRVYNEYGRVVDIRLWPEMERDPVIERKTFERTWNSWAKDHAHRQRGASMRRNDLRNVAMALDEDNAGYTGHASPKLSSGDAWDIYEKRHDSKWCGSKSWKDQSKSRKQWCKHKDKPQYASIRHVPFELPPQDDTDDYFDLSDDLIAG